MALIVEDGSGRTDSESYISVANATARHAAFGNTAWAALATDALREAALRNATAYMQQAYRSRWTGLKLTAAQALDWPRYGVVVDGYDVASDIVPTEIANACADLALKASAGELNADLERAVIREKVGPLEIEYSAHSPQQIRYRAIDQMLSPYLSGSSASFRVTRT